ncbi:hypothetical protein GRX03_13475 [Halovenus sp. WSH3]|uniref:Uncharacterized protein n=1 Tax=Halovenus carboxidivorans TaxID=2692199 RepID=A0A6B0TBK3_9EURY|nr:hypothetical protein [Halovenus carboxidivorans]MXR52611.1 hypothetical protein [Halovenus carboxidivorans]
MGTEPSFTIPSRPQRRYPYSGGVEYEGQTIFRLIPSRSRSNEQLSAALEQTLDAGPYRYGDFYNLPMALFLVRDEGTGDVFRASVRDGRIRLHVLPETGSAGLRRLYDRLVERSDCEYRVECETAE